jgi:tetratricopeptide (TPR) repeat protein
MSRVRRLLPLLGCVLLGCVLLTLYAPGGVLRRDEPPPAPASWSPYDLSGSIQARRTTDTAYYVRAQGAFERSLRQPTGDGEPYIDALIGMGALTNARHDFATAVGWAERARKAAPFRWALYGVLTDAHLELGQYEQAETTLRRMLDGHPDLASFTRAARLEHLRGRPGPARDLLHRACAIPGDPAEYAFCQWQLGELAWNNGDPRTALSAYTKALAADPEHGPSRAGKARAEAALGHTDQALRDYATAVARSPSLVIEYGELLEHLGDGEGARRQYAVFTAQHKLLAANGDTDSLAMGTFEANHGDADAAVRHLREEWKRRQSVEVADALGWALHQAGHHTEAAAYATRADALGGRNALFAYHRGEIEHALGHTAAARAHLSRALSINPNFSPAGATRARALLAETP